MKKIVLTNAAPFCEIGVFTTGIQGRGTLLLHSMWQILRQIEHFTTAFPKPIRFSQTVHTSGITTVFVWKTCKRLLGVLLFKFSSLCQKSCKVSAGGAVGLYFPCNMNLFQLQIQFLLFSFTSQSSVSIGTDSIIDVAVIGPSFGTVSVVVARTVSVVLI